MSKDIILPSILEGEDKSSPFKNCIRNNYKHLKKWAKRTETDCFRLYDRNIHHYPVAIDLYAGRFCVHYFSKTRDEEEPSEEFKNEVNEVLNSIFGATPEVIYWRIRAKNKETRQYEKKGESKEFFVVHESGIKFRVNLQDYLDTGLFLDHRETRRMISLEAKGKRFLNLFAYTGSFSVYAAVAGATFTKTVDLSNTYCAWTKENFLLNGLSLKNNEIVRADCLKFLDEEIGFRAKYDLIVIDPPTISRSKKMDGLFDVQIDYIPLISKCLRIISSNGTIFFSTNSRKFSFDQALFPNCSIEEVTDKTIPIDFKDSKIHRCWKIT